MSSRPWTSRELKALAADFDAGASVQAIARHLGRSPTSVWGATRRLGLVWRARGTLAQEIEAAKREAATAPLYRPGDRV